MGSCIFIEFLFELSDIGSWVLNNEHRVFYFNFETVYSLEGILKELLK